MKISNNYIQNYSLHISIKQNNTTFLLFNQLSPEHTKLKRSFLSKYRKYVYCDFRNFILNLNVEM